MPRNQTTARVSILSSIEITILHNARNAEQHIVKRRYWNEPGVREKISARGRANYQKLKNKHNEGWD